MVHLLIYIRWNIVEVKAEVAIHVPYKTVMHVPSRPRFS